jgi:hypothetical protein
MEVIEFTTPEDQEALPENMAELRAEMAQKIDYAVSLGVFTDKEAQDWHNGFEACTEVEHMEGLIDIIDDFIDSGWEIVSEIEGVLATGEISETEKNSFLIQMEGMSYDDKVDLAHDLERILNEVSRKKAKLKVVLSQSNIRIPEAALLEQEFGQATLDGKDKVIRQAELMARDQGKPKESKADLRLREVIDLQIQAGNLREARHMVEKSFPDGLSYGEYVRLDATINRLEIQQKQADARQIYKAAA